ncbi:MAG: glutamate dehydrogenase, partial [Burkholderiaceae bacterium]|nr:glutamate dehydrogenase [Burkholderiaceae bacterium]
RCGPLMLVELAARHQVEESAVILAWAQAWSALNLAPLFAALDAHALTIPTATSKQLDARTRVLQQAVTGGILSAAKDLKPASLAELEAIFGDTASVQALIPAQAGGEFEQARATVDAIAAMADFLFAALTIARPAGLSLPALLQTGVELRRSVGIDLLEQALMNLPAGDTQLALRNRALDALRRSQQQLLALALRSSGAVQTLTAKLQSKGERPGTIEQAVLEAWTLSEAAAAAAA